MAKRYPKICIGDIFKTKKCGDVEVLLYKNAREIDVIFINTGTLRNVASKELRDGAIKDPMCPSIHGIGYRGIGTHMGWVGGESTEVYNRWCGMLGRCYNPSSQDYKRYGLKGVTVCDSWHNFQIFAEWFFRNHRNGFEIDKDILYQNSTIYGPDTCVFIPQSLNKMMTFSDSARGDLPIGVTYRDDCAFKYMACVTDHMTNKRLWKTSKTPREAYEWYVVARKKSISDAAKHYLKLGDISEEVYTALLNYKIEEYKIKDETL